MSVQLYLGDCLEVMQELADGSVDAVVTDPPYGVKITSNSKAFGVSPQHSRKATEESWDDKVPDKLYFDHMFRVSHNQIIFGGNYFLDYLPSSRCYIVWDKRGDLPDVPFSPVEWAWASYNKMPKRYVVRNHGFIRDSREKREHPTQKPLLLFRKIIEDFTNLGDTILDPFMGSGTTGVACVQTGRNFIGIEIEPKYYEIAEARIAEAQLQIRMEI